jgi:CDP-2,3-bis-(O-geranylgeranyl)-sn-glycerol synthase
MDPLTAVAGALLVVGQSFWLFFPAYVSGSAAVLFKGKTPMDLGRSWRGKRLFGDGKTWEGFILGGLTGVFAGTMQQLVVFLSGYPTQNLAGTVFWGTFDPFLHPEMSWGALGVTACLSYGGLFGDLLKSFIKRRMGLTRGSKSPLLMDQLDFIVGATILIVLFFHQWLWDVFTVYGIPLLLNYIALLVMTPLLHRGVNIIGFKLGAKKEPW